MKKFTSHVHVCLFLLSASLMLACNNAPRNEKVYLSSLTNTDKEVKLADTDFRFLIKAYSLGLFKISLAKEAQVRSTSVESHQLATAVVNFHSDLNNQIKEIADKHAFSLPIDLTDEQKLQWKILVKERGWNFDKKFGDMLCDLIQEEAAVYEYAIKNGADENVVVVAKKAQPDLRLHEVLRATLNEKIDEKTIAVVSEDVEKSKSKNKKKIVAAKS